jgi:hypothetical protein
MGMGGGSGGGSIGMGKPGVRVNPIGGQGKGGHSLMAIW